jgi:hypothetical protein
MSTVLGPQGSSSPSSLSAAWPSRAAILASVFALSGCKLIDRLRDKVSDLTNRVAAAGSVLGVEPPENENISALLENTQFSAGAQASIFFADAASGGGFAEAPLSDEEVTYDSESNDGLPMPLVSPGQYAITEMDGLVFTPGETATLRALDDDDQRELSVRIPFPADVNIPDSLSPNTSLDLDVSDQDFDGLIVVVINTADGTSTFSTLPTSPTDLYNITHGDGLVTSVEVPGAAFPSEGYFVLGVAGVYAADEASFEGVNTAISTLIAGNFTFHPICTYNNQALCVL